MKRSFRSITAAVALLTASMLTSNAATPPPGHVDFGEIDSSRERERVDVHISGAVLSMAARLVESKQPDAGEILRGLESVRVRVIGLGDDNREEVTNKIEAIRRQLVAQGWERIVAARDKGEDVAIHIKTRGGEAVQGLAVTVISGKKEAVLVNIVGDIKPENLASLGESLGIDPLKKLGGKPTR